jgi:hypothetical protein
MARPLESIISTGHGGLVGEAGCEDERFVVIGFFPHGVGLQELTQCLS